MAWRKRKRFLVLAIEYEQMLLQFGQNSIALTVDGISLHTYARLQVNCLLTQNHTFRSNYHFSPHLQTKTGLLVAHD